MIEYIFVGVTIINDRLLLSTIYRSNGEVDLKLLPDLLNELLIDMWRFTF